MPVQSVEALLDAGSDRLVRAEWGALAGARLPSQANQLGPAAAPHVTLARGLGSRQVGEALAVLGRTRPIDGQLESVRRWNPITERARTLGA